MKKKELLIEGTRDEEEKKNLTKGIFRYKRHGVVVVDVD